MGNSTSSMIIDDGSDEDIKRRLKSLLESWEQDDIAVDQSNQIDEFITSNDGIDIPIIAGPAFLDDIPQDSEISAKPLEEFIPVSISLALRNYGLSCIGDLINVPKAKIVRTGVLSSPEVDQIESTIRESLMQNGIEDSIRGSEVNKNQEYKILLPSGEMLPEHLARLNLRADLELTPALAAKLKQRGITKVGDLAGIPFSELETIKGIGSGTLRKMIFSLRQAGIPEEFWKIKKIKQEEQSPLDAVPNKPGDVVLATGEIMSDKLCRLRIREDLGLTAGRAKSLANYGYTRVSDLAGISVETLKAIPGLGSGAIDALFQKMRDKGIPDSFWDEGTFNFKKGSFRTCMWNSLTFATLDQSDVRKSIVGDSYTYVPPTSGTCISVHEDKLKVPIYAVSSKRTIASFLPGEYTLGDISDDASLEIISRLQTDDIENMQLITGREEPDRILLLDFITLPLGIIAKRLGFNNASRLANEIFNQLVLSGTEINIASYAESLRESWPDFCIDLDLDLFDVDLNYQEVFFGSSIREMLEQLDEHPILFCVIDDILDSILFSLNLARQAESYEQLVSQILLDSKTDIAPRSIAMTSKYMIPQEHKVTLQTVADEYGLTRERVRQIIAKHQNLIDTARSYRTFAIYLYLYCCIREHGGWISNDEASRLINDDLHNLGPAYKIAGFFDGIQISDDGEISLAAIPCTKCTAAGETCASLNESNECVECDQLIEDIGCGACSLFSRANPQILASTYNLVTSGNLIGSAANPTIRAMRRPDSLRSQLYEIMYNSPHALNYDQMLEALQKKTEKETSKARVSSMVGSFEDCLLWGRGTYIHERHVPDPKELLSAIADFVCEYFSSRKIPLVGVEAVYSIFKEELLAAGVPNHQALYSLLRRHNDKRLILREYPWICDARSVGDRTSFAKYFYWVLEDNNGFITDEHAEKIAERTMAQSFALGGLAEYSPYLINANGGWYDIATAGFDMEGIASLAIELASTMNDNDIVSAVAVFENYRERCFKYGVKSYDMLYYLVDMMEDDSPIEATRKPHFVKSEHKGLSAINAMRLYIENSSKPVSRDELYEEFITKRRLNLRGICGSLLINDSIIQVGDDLFWSRENLSIDESFMSRFDEIIQEGINRNRANKIADLFYARGRVLPDYSSLPSLHGLMWNPVLLKAVFSKSKKYRLYGEGGTCIVNIEDNPQVVNVEAFYVKLLENEFMGWSSFDSFADYCRAQSIRTHLEPEFFDAFSNIEADEISIQLK